MSAGLLWQSGFSWIPAPSGMSDTGTRRETGMTALLSTRAAIPPDVPVGVQPLLLAQFLDMRRGDALVVAIVPLTDVLGDLDPGCALPALAEWLAVCCPWQLILAGQVEQF